MKHTQGELTPTNDGKGFDMEGMRHIFLFTDKGFIFGRIDGHRDGLACGKPSISMEEATANANRLATSWNQHDTLQAKADLVDEMEDLLLTVSMISPASECEYCLENSHCPYGSVEECIRSKAKILATKAKELL